MEAGGISENEELKERDNGTMTVSPIHLPTKESVSLSIKDYNDLKKRLETAEHIYAFLKSSRNLWRDEWS